MKKLIIAVAAIIIVLGGILVFNTLSLKSKQVDPEPLETMKFPEMAFQNLSKAVQFKTISFSGMLFPTRLHSMDSINF